MTPSFPFLITIAVSAVAIADVALKQTSVMSDGSAILRNPWLWLAVVLYLGQIALFVYLLEHRVNLSYIGVFQMAVYAVVVLGASFFLFHERVGSTQAIGIALAVIGTFLISLPR